MFTSVKDGKNAFTVSLLSGRVLLIIAVQHSVKSEMRKSRLIDLALHIKIYLSKI